MLKRLISTISEGQDFSKRIFLQNQGKRISPWHDIPLYSSTTNLILPSVIEICRESKAKFEVNLKEEYNPIKQDTKKNKDTGKVELRNYAIYPLFNYGMLPQTWENPFEKDEKYGLVGDGDPLDTLDIGSEAVNIGTIIQVKVLGALCLIDQGELDWKILCINTSDPRHKELKTQIDIERLFPGKINAIVEWLENIKVYDGKPKNKVLGSLVSSAETLKIIDSAHNTYKELKNNKYPEAKVWLG